MATKKVVTAAERKASLLDVGAKLASKHGVKNVTRRMLANAAKVSEPLVSSHLGTRATMHATLAKQAKKLGLSLPDAARTLLIGKKLRAHKPKVAVVAKPAKPQPEAIKAIPAAPENKAVTLPTAAREPKAPPVIDSAV